MDKKKFFAFVVGGFLISIRKPLCAFGNARACQNIPKEMTAKDEG